MTTNVFKNNEYLVKEFGINDLKINFSNMHQDYLMRELTFIFDNFNFKISPFPACCGIRIVNYLSYYPVNNIPLEKVSIWLKFAIDLDMYFNKPGRYLAVIPREELRPYSIQSPYIKVHQIINKVGFVSLDTDPKHSGSYNYVMESVNQLFELITEPSTNNDFIDFCSTQIRIY